MLNWLRNLLKDKHLEEELDNLRKTSAQMFDALKDLQKEKEKAEQELWTYREKLQANDDKRNDKEPWIEIVSESFDEERGIQISLDWNDAFVEYLKENGYQGTNEEEIVRLYLAFLYRDIVERIEANTPQEPSKSEKRVIRD